MIRERVIAGVEKAKAKGTHCGRPSIEVDMRVVRALLKEGRSRREVGRIVKVSPATLARRLGARGKTGKEPTP